MTPLSSLKNCYKTIFKFIFWSFLVLGLIICLCWAYWDYRVFNELLEDYANDNLQKDSSNNTVYDSSGVPRRASAWKIGFFQLVLVATLWFSFYWLTDSNFPEALTWSWMFSFLKLYAKAESSEYMDLFYKVTTFPDLWNVILFTGENAEGSLATSADLKRANFFVKQMLQ